MLDRGSKINDKQKMGIAGGCGAPPGKFLLLTCMALATGTPRNRVPGIPADCVTVKKWQPAQIQLAGACMTESQSVSGSLLFFSLQLEAGALRCALGWPRQDALLPSYN